MMKKQKKIALSVVVPIAKGDVTWRTLLPQLFKLDSISEIIISSTEDQPVEFTEFLTAFRPVHWIKGPAGRAQQLNLGAERSNKEWIWFLHADSVLIDGTQIQIERTISSDASGIHYFDLKFLTDQSRFMQINEVGVWIRSRLLKMPFGDQGFIIKNDTFKKLGRFDEGANFGEDHLLIWKAHQLGYPVIPIKFPIGTSARKYRQNGWLKTTTKHLLMTARQALPEAIKTFRKRRRHEVS